MILVIELQFKNMLEYAIALYLLTRFYRRIWKKED